MREGYSLALEVGFSKAGRKGIFLVEKVEDPSVKHYFEVVR